MMKHYQATKPPVRRESPKVITMHFVNHARFRARISKRKLE